MGSIWASGDHIGSYAKQVIGKAFMLIAGLSVWPGAMAAPTQVSLCGADETPLFNCPVGHKIVSVCTMGGKANYRFGSPGKVEMSSQALSFAETGFSGGGETQIIVKNGNYSYVVFDTTTRTSFSSDGHNDSDFTSGLVVQKNGKTISAVECGSDATISADAGRVIPSGAFIAH